MRARRPGPPSQPSLPAIRRAIIVKLVAYIISHIRCPQRRKQFRLLYYLKCPIVLVAMASKLIVAL